MKSLNSIEIVRGRVIALEEIKQLLEREISPNIYFRLSKIRLRFSSSLSNPSRIA
jgi:hypothetical protein